MFSKAPNSKSRIPVPVTSQKSSSVCNTERSLIEKQSQSRLQALAITQDSHSHFQKKLVVQSSSQAGRLETKSITRTGKEMKLVNNAPLSGGCKIKSNDKKTTKQLPLKTNINSNKSKHFTALKTNVKHPISKNKIQPSSKTGVRCDGEIKEQSLTKANKACDDKKFRALTLNVKHDSAKAKSNSYLQSLLKTNKGIDGKDEPPIGTVTPQCDDENELATPCNALTKQNDMLGKQIDEDKPPIITVTSQCEDGKELATPCNASTRKRDVLSKQVCFSDQKGIVFEANELYRNMILSGRQPSPSICKQIPGFRLSSIQVQRPSAYQKFEMSADPLKEALEAIKNVCLSAKRIEKSSAKENKMPSSPFKDRGSFYTPCENPRAEVMKSLEEFKLKRLQKSLSKSSKKVTFNLKVQDCTPKDVINPMQNSEKRLTKISEKSEENTPASPQGERLEVLPLNQDNGVKTSELTKNKVYIEQVEPKFTDPIKSVQNGYTIKLEESENFTPCVKSIHSPIVNEKCDKLLPTNSENNSQQNSLTLTNIICDAKKNASEVPASHVRSSCSPEIERSNAVHMKIKNAKVYTPQPVSLYSKFRISDSSSPEFLSIGKSASLVDLAPICTPFVLKSIAKQNTVSPEAKPIDDPVRLKLDFTEVEKESPRRETCRNQAAESLKNIITIQKKLDNLADKECSLLLSYENTPILRGRYLINPIASTLNEGDDMHFIPISL